ncbi:zinc knuckle CX2CX4HX4C [Artemisia annua]|uniref:Zinc knuckle CX2CX4HX4C n=1 Tax=Artemisia annua TaxID=35608 RepID=A0A2U1NNU2_ARTAN|nr:zinc knuckle CX2CX4HX4C [Artemisia annua]
MKQGFLSSGWRGDNHDVSIEDVTSVKMLEGKLVLVGDDGVALKPVNADSQATDMELFPSFKKVANLCTLIVPASNGVDVAVSKESVLQVKECFEISIYGFFLGKRVSYPMVENYITNEWSIFGIVCSMMDSKGIFFFKFNSNTGMESMLENGPWMICNMPLIVRKWSPLVNVSKEDLKSVPTSKMKVVKSGKYLRHHLRGDYSGDWQIVVLVIMLFDEEEEGDCQVVQVRGVASRCTFFRKVVNDSEFSWRLVR